MVFSLLKPGDEIVYLGPLYGGTEGLFYDLVHRYGIAIKDATDRPLAEAIGRRTRMVYVETPANPTLRIHDLAEVARISRARGLVSVADNTFATPVFTRPLDLAIWSRGRWWGRRRCLSPSAPRGYGIWVGCSGLLRLSSCSRA